MARRPKSRRLRSGFEVEGLESRRLLALAYQFVPLGAGDTQNPITPTSIATGPDGNIWFTIDKTSSPISGIGEVDATTGALALYATPTQGVDLGSLIKVGGDLYFAEYNPTTFASAIGIFNPTTHAIVEIPVNDKNADVAGITQGTDGNIYFTDVANDAIGEFVVNDPAHPVTETLLPKLNEAPEAITTASNGLIFYGYGGGIGSFDPTTGAIAQAALSLPGSGGGPARATSFVDGGDGKLYFSVDIYRPAEALDFIYISEAIFYSLASLDPTAPLTAAEITYDSALSGGFATPGGDLGPDSFTIALEPDGNIAFTEPTAISPYGGNPDEVGEYNIATQAVTTTGLPAYQVAGTSAPVVAPNGSIYFAAGGAVGIATPIAPDQSTIIGTVISETYSDVTNTLADAGGQGGIPRPGQLVYLDLMGDGTLDPGDPTAVTDANGTYTFTGLAPGTYTVRVVPYGGAFDSAPAGGGGLSVTTTGGAVTNVTQELGVGQNSVLAPLAIDLSPFGASPPDVYTAEVTADYNIILGRAPDPTGLAADVAYLKAGGSLQALAQALLTSAEYDTRVVAGFYQAFLGRSGSIAEVDGWVAAMQADGLTTAQVAEDFLDSAEFNADHPDNTSFVQALYEGTLGRQPSSAELTAWDAALAGGVARTQAVYDVVYSTESLEIPITIALNLFAPSQALNAGTYAMQVQAGTTSLAAAIAEIAGLPEFVQRANAAVPG